MAWRDFYIRWPPLRGRIGKITPTPGRDPGYWKASPQGWKKSPPKMDEIVAPNDERDGRPALKDGRMLLPLPWS
jgi:hypothetical protein